MVKTASASSGFFTPALRIASSLTKAELRSSIRRSHIQPGPTLSLSVENIARSWFSGRRSSAKFSTASSNSGSIARAIQSGSAASRAGMFSHASWQVCGIIGASSLTSVMSISWITVWLARRRGESGASQYSRSLTADRYTLDAWTVQNSWISLVARWNS